MDGVDTVMVYHFRVYDLERREMRVAGFKATRLAIERRPGAELIDGTGHAVPADEIDAEGAHRRIATGWGGLG